MENGFISHLQKAKLKVTPARLLVLEVLAFTHVPQSAENISEKLKKKKINQVTVYRTLASLLEKGIIKRVDLRKDSVFYELPHHHHHHITCTKCGVIEEFEYCDIDEISKKIVKKSKAFSMISEHSLELFGVCKVCKI